METNQKLKKRLSVNERFNIVYVYDIGNPSNDEFVEFQEYFWHQYLNDDFMTK